MTENDKRLNEKVFPVGNVITILHACLLVVLNSALNLQVRDPSHSHSLVGEIVHGTSNDQIHRDGTKNGTIGASIPRLGRHPYKGVLTLVLRRDDSSHPPHKESIPIPGILANHQIAQEHSVGRRVLNVACQQL